MNSNSGTALVRPLIGLGAAITLIVCFFLPWATQGGYAASLWDFMTKSNSSDMAWPLIYLLSFGGAGVATAGSVIRAALNRSPATTRRMLAIVWVAGFAMALGGIALYMVKLTDASNNFYAYDLAAGFGVWLAIPAAVVGLIAGIVDLAMPGGAAWTAGYGTPGYGVPGYGQPSGYGQAPWPAPQGPAQPGYGLQGPAPVQPMAPAYGAPGAPGRLTYVEAGRSSSLTVNPGEQVLVGRDPGARIRLSDPRVSRQHAVIQRSGNDWVVRDLGATNPTRLLGAGGAAQTIQGEVRVSTGQLLVGDVLVTLFPTGA